MLLSMHAFSSNLIGNGDFELGTTFGSNYWASITNPVNQTISLDNTSQISGVYVIKAVITTADTYYTRCGITQLVLLPKAATYTVTFKAKASTNCTIQAQLVNTYTGTPHLVSTTFQNFNVTTAVQTFSYDITTTTTNSGACKMEFLFGTIASGITIYFDDISMVEKTPLTDRNLCNGDFETSMSNYIYLTGNSTYNGLTTGTPDATQNQLYYGWTLYKVNSSTAKDTAIIDSSNPISGSKSIVLTSTGTATVVPTDASLIWEFTGQKDKFYTLSFKAKASASCNMAVEIVAGAWANAACNYLSPQTCNLTTSVQTFTYTTTLPFLQSAVGSNLLKFELGKVPNGVSITLDDVVLSIKETPVITWSQDLSGLKTTDSPIALTASSPYTSSVLPAANDITYSSDKPDVVSVSGTNLIVVGAGTANVTASQSNNSFYFDANQVTVPVTVSSNVATGISNAASSSLYTLAKNKVRFNVEGEVQIMNLAGQTIINQNVQAGSVIDLKSGVYLLHLLSKNGAVAKKIVI